MRRLLLSLLVFVVVVGIGCRVQHEQQESPQTNVFFIGLDGVSWNVADRLMAEGRMPVLADLIQRGMRARLATTGAISPSKWTTMATGRLPSKHGIIGFEVLEGDRKVKVSSYHRRGKAVWNWVSEDGRSVGVVNYPVSFPPEVVNGYIAAMKRGGLHPPDLDASFEPYPVDRFLPAPNCDSERRATLETNFSRLSNQLSKAATLRGRYPTDLFLAYTHTTDATEHQFWKFMEPEKFRSPVWGLNEADIECFANSIPNFLEATDILVGRILENRDENSVVIIASDHGQRAKKDVEINPIFLYDELYAALGLQHRDESGELDGTQARLVSADPSKFDRHEWARLVIPEGVESDTRQTRLAEIARTLRELKIEPTGVSLFPGVVLRGQHGTPRPNEPPEWDVWITEALEYKQQAGRLSLTIDGKRHPLEDFIRGVDVSGHHLYHGIFVAAGPNIRRTDVMPDLKGVDVMPTLMHILGLPIPEGIDGRVMEPIFEPDWLEQNPAVFFQPKEEPGEGVPATKDRKHLDPADDKALTDELRALGYIQ